jgi:hypothetical protein
MLLSEGGGGLIVRVNVSLTPPYETVKVTGGTLVIADALAENVIEIDPCGIVMLAGTLTPPEEAAIEMRAPPLFAADVSATVQSADAGVTSDIGLQVNPFRAGGLMPMFAPTVAVVIDIPAKSAADPLASWTAEETAVVEFETVRETVATTPFEIGVSFRAYKTHVSVPGALVQEIPLLALAAADPSCTLMDEKSVVE